MMAGIRDCPSWERSGLLLGRRSEMSDIPVTGGDAGSGFAFSLFDDDGDGLISASDITRTVRGLGLQMTDEDAAAFVTDADADGTGLISEAEFDAVRSQEQLPDGVTTAEDAFAAFDTSGDGSISLTE